MSRILFAGWFAPSKQLDPGLRRDDDGKDGARQKGRSGRLGIAACLLLLIALLCGSPAAAHLTPNSEIGLDIGRTKLVASITIPLGELLYAEKIGTDPAALQAYVLRHMMLRSADGRAWQPSVTSVHATADAAPDLLAVVEWTPPAGADLRHFALHYDAVIDRTPNHFVLVMLHTDFEAGHLSDRPEMLGGLQHGNETVVIDRGPGSAWRGFAGAVRLGMHHIAEGHDHLLFLIALLLPAPVLAQSGRWTGQAGRRQTVMSLLKVVTAFTIGHSITLIGGAFFGWQLPARPVEVMIALSILISAVHAWRPIFAGREPIVAAGFGLVHGLAFATLIGHFGLEPLQKAQSILGFNVGIELVQLLVVALVTPGLFALTTTPYYALFRNGMALFAGGAAAIWFVERLIGREYGAGRAIDAGLDYAPWLLVVFAIGSVVLLVARRRVSSAPRTSSISDP